MFDGDKIFPVIAILCAVLIILLMVGWSVNKDEFMKECMQYEKKYECTALYRGHR